MKRSILRSVLFFLIFIILIGFMNIYKEADAEEKEGALPIAIKIENLKFQKQFLDGAIQKAKKEFEKMGPVEPLDPMGKDLPESVRYEWMNIWSKEQSFRKELQIKYHWLEETLRQADESARKANSARSPEVAQSYRKEAQNQAELAERLLKLFIGTPPESQEAQGISKATKGTSSSSLQGEGGKKLEQTDPFNAPILNQIKLNQEWSGQVTRTSDPQAILNKAKEDFGEGRAGAGGVSIYKSAELETPIDMQKVKKAFIENNHLFLFYGDTKIPFPFLDPDCLALALRIIYKNEGLVKGKFVEEDSTALVIQTGKEQFGEIVWKKEFLPEPWVTTSPNSLVLLELAPGIGFLSQPEPSTDRVTYYGPIKGTQMGSILLEADGLLTTFLTGVNWKTGIPEPPPSLEGFMTHLEKLARKVMSSQPEKENVIKKEDAAKKEKKKWWKDTAWLVWVPDSFVLKLTETSFDFVETKMKLAIWSANKEYLINESKELIELGQFVTQHYKGLSSIYPVLKDLEEVTKAVSVVRWLKKNKIPVDISWALNHKLQKAETPESVRSFTVLLVKDVTGKPLVEKGVKP